LRIRFPIKQPEVHIPHFYRLTLTYLSNPTSNLSNLSNLANFLFTFSPFHLFTHFTFFTFSPFHLFTLPALERYDTWKRMTPCSLQEITTLCIAATGAPNHFGFCSIHYEFLGECIPTNKPHLLAIQGE
jgi:hypothetical protein